MYSTRDEIEDKSRKFCWRQSNGMCNYSVVAKVNFIVAIADI